jgi:hypothetical protein
LIKNHLWRSELSQLPCPKAVWLFSHIYDWLQHVLH